MDTEPEVSLWALHGGEVFFVEVWSTGWQEWTHHEETFYRIFSEKDFVGGLDEMEKAKSFNRKMIKDCYERNPDALELAVKAALEVGKSQQPVEDFLTICRLKLQVALQASIVPVDMEPEVCLWALHGGEVFFVEVWNTGWQEWTHHDETFDRIFYEKDFVRGLHDVQKAKNFNHGVIKGCCERNPDALELAVKAALEVGKSQQPMEECVSYELGNSTDIKKAKNFNHQMIKGHCERNPDASELAEKAALEVGKSQQTMEEFLTLCRLKLQVALQASIVPVDMEPEVCLWALHGGEVFFVDVWSTGWQEWTHHDETFDRIFSEKDFIGGLDDMKKAKNFIHKVIKGHCERNPDALELAVKTALKVGKSQQPMEECVEDELGNSPDTLRRGTKRRME